MTTKEQFLAMKASSVSERFKKTIAIHSAGTLAHGYWTPERSEGRWGQAMIKMLGENGYNVWAANVNVEWNDCMRLFNVLPVNINEMKPTDGFDLVIDSSWNSNNEESFCYQLGSKAYLANFWQCDKQIRGDDCMAARPNHWYSYTLWDSYNKYDDENEDAKHSHRKVFLPLPLYRSLPTPNISKVEIMWTPRDLCNPERLKRNLALLSAIKKMTEVHPEVSCIFQLFNELDHPDCSQEIKDAIDAINNRVEFRSGVLRNNFVDALKRTKIIITNGFPAVSMLYLEGVANGAIPLLWEGKKKVVWEQAGELGMLLPEDADENVIFEHLEKLYCDDEYYTKVWNSLLSELWCHQEDVSLAIFDNQLKMMLDNYKE